MQCTHVVILAGRNRGKATLESSDTASAQRASCPVDGSQPDGATLGRTLKSFNPTLSVYLVHLFTPTMDVAAAVGEEEEA